MTKSTTKRALLLSVISMIVCLSMLVGSTFAWFTDKATTGVNKIVSGNLDISLEMLVGGKWVPAEGQTLGFVDEEGNVLNDILWEPGCSYLLQPFRITNNGNLALKFDVVVSGISGDLKLAEVIEYGVPLGDVNNPQFVSMGNLLDFNSLFSAIEESGLTVLQPKESLDTESDKITFHMKEEAGNEYQGLTLSGMSITVVATQLNYENDSFGPDYDKDAEWPLVMTDDAAIVANVLAQNQDAKIILNGDVTLDGVTEIAGEKLIDLNGNALTVTEEKGITVPENATLTVDNGTIAYTGSDIAPIFVQSNSVVNIEDGAVFDITSTAVAGQWSQASAVYVNSGSNSTVNINGGIINVTGDNAIGVYANYAGGGNHTVNLNGGVINVNGTGAIGMDVVSTNTINLNGGVINVKGTGAVAFNVGQSQGQPTVVTGNGQTTVNLYEGTTLCYEDENDAAQFEGVAMTVNQAKVLTGTEEEVKNELDRIIKENDSALVELPKGDYTLPSVAGKDVTIVGDKDTVIDTTNGISGTTGAKLTFKGVTLEFKDSTDYQGFTHSSGVVFEDCVINGTMFLYSNTEFINCTFNADGNYNVWTYGSNATFTGCTFNTQGRAILVYNGGEVHATVTVNDCTFNATETYSSPKAAIEVGASDDANSPTRGDTTYKLVINNCTADADHFFANKSTSNLWGNKNSMDQDHLDVVLDGVDVY